MPLTAAQIQAAVDQLAADIAKFHEIVQGDDLTDIPTDSGIVPSISKFYVEALNAIALQGFPGFLNSNPISVSSTYNVLTTDNGSTVVVSGATSFSGVVFGDPSTYPTPFVLEIVNANAIRAVDVIPQGTTRVRLFPGQGTIVKKFGGAWRFIVPVPRPNLTMTFYVDTVSGNDDMNSNDGLAPTTGAFQTVPSAWEYIRVKTDGGVGIVCAPGQIHPSWGTLVGDSFGMAYRNITISGDATYANPPIIQLSGADLGMHFRDNCLASVDGFKIQSSGNGSTAVQLTGIAYVDLRSMVYGSMPLGAHLVCGEKSLCNVTLATGQTVAEKIIGGAAVHWRADGYAKLQISGNVDLTNSTPDFSGAAFIISVGHGMLTTAHSSPTAFLNASGGTNGILGPQAILQQHSIVVTNGVTIPGTAPTVDATSNIY